MVLLLDGKQVYNRSLCSLSVVNEIAPTGNMVEGTTENHIYHLHTHRKIKTKKKNGRKKEEQ